MKAYQISLVFSFLVNKSIAFVPSAGSLSRRVAPLFADYEREFHLDNDGENENEFDNAVFTPDNEDEDYRFDMENDNLFSDYVDGYDDEEYASQPKSRKPELGKWIVLVDDEESVRKAVGQLLFDEGYDVSACTDAKTALMVMTEEEDRVPDAVVTDIRMPDMDGIELVQNVRMRNNLVAIPVVLLSAKSLVDDRIVGYQVGADYYLSKPFDPQELLAVVEAGIKRRESLSGELNSANVRLEDLQKDLAEIKKKLLDQGGAGLGGVGKGKWVEATNVFLTPDERKVLNLLSEGLMNVEIAERLFLSVRRVQQHLTSMFRKTNTSNRTELVRWAVATGNVVM